MGAGAGMGAEAGMEAEVGAAGTSRRAICTTVPARLGSCAHCMLQASLLHLLGFKRWSVHRSSSKPLAWTTSSKIYLCSSCVGMSLWRRHSWRDTTRVTEVAAGFLP